MKRAITLILTMTLLLILCRLCLAAPVPFLRGLYLVAVPAVPLSFIGPAHFLCLFVHLLHLLF